MDAIRQQVPEEGSIDGALRTLAAAQHGVFSRAQAAALGATDSHLKHGVARGRYNKIRRGIFALAGMPESFRQRVMAACLGDNGRTFASHRTAAAIWSMAGSREGLIEVTTIADRRPWHDVVTHRVLEMPACDTAMFDAIPVTTPTRTLLDLAAVVDETSLEIALDDALRRGLTSMPRLRWRLSETGGRGRAGTKMIERILEQRAGGPSPESPLETKVIRALRTASLPEPRRQYRVVEKGRTIGRVDLAWPAQRVVLEVESYRYHTGRHEWERDLARRNALESAGWKVVHITSQQLTANRAGFLRQLTALLDGQTSFFGEE